MHDIEIGGLISEMSEMLTDKKQPCDNLSYYLTHGTFFVRRINSNVLLFCVMCRYMCMLGVCVFDLEIRLLLTVPK